MMKMKYSQFSQPHQRFTLSNCFKENLLYYETPKVVRFESRWIACVAFIIKLVLGITCFYLMFQRDSYQIFDRSPISAVTIKVKHAPDCSNNASLSMRFSEYNCDYKSVFDVNDFILPAIENAAISITTRLVQREFILQPCEDATNEMKNLSMPYRCQHVSRCIVPPRFRSNEQRMNQTNNVALCWFQLPLSDMKMNYPALDYVLFIKHFIEFPHLSLVRHNLLSNVITRDYLKTCEYDPNDHPLCPKFRLSKLLYLIEKDPNEYERMFSFGSLIEIQIDWKCNLDRRIEFCEPTYKFQRLDVKPYENNPYDPGSNYHLAKQYFQPNDTKLHRVHIQVYNIRIMVIVTGEAGRFDLFQTTTSIGSFVGIFSTGAIVCDLFAAFMRNFRHVKYDH